MRTLMKSTVFHHRLWRNTLIAVLALVLLAFLIRSAAF